MTCCLWITAVASLYVIQAAFVGSELDEMMIGVSGYHFGMVCIIDGIDRVLWKKRWNMFHIGMDI